MTRLVLRPRAAADVEEAYRWYESRSLGLGEEFLEAVSVVLGQILENPRQFPVVHRHIRRALLKRFPYGVYFCLVEQQVIVVACFHASRDPQEWRSRG